MTPSSLVARIGRRIRPIGRLFPRAVVATAVVGFPLAGGSPAVPAIAQPLTERTPNLAGTWVSSPLTLNFQFAHRFETVGSDADIGDLFGDAKVVNYPTFDLSLGLFEGAMAGVRYSSNSLIASGQPNEWQPYLKYAPLRAAGRGRVSVSVLGAWNGANESLDGELAAQTQLGPVLFSGAVRGYTNLYDLSEEESGEALALAGGLGVKVNRYVTLAGDVGGVVAGGELAGEKPDAAWSAGLHIGIPFTPHTFSIMATNVTSGTLQGVSGVPAGLPSNVYWGFEFTVPFSGFARWGRIFKPEETGSPEARQAAAAGRAVVEIEISQLAFQTKDLEIPVGTTVRWVNKDPIAHTSTDDDGTWESPLLGPGETYEYTFDEVGEYAYHCVPHPFMTAKVVVKEAG